MIAIRPGLVAAFALALVPLLAPPPAAAGEVELIPRQVLFGNPERSNVELSPDGQRISFLADVEGVSNVWVGPVSDPASARPVTRDTGRGIRIYLWAWDSRHIVCLQDKDGDENWRAYSVDVETRQERDLTPLEGVRAEIQGVSHKHPRHILVGLNDRDARLHDLYRVDLVTGERQLIEKNPGYVAYLADDDYRPRLAIEMTPAGTVAVNRRNGDGDWERFFEYAAEDNLTTQPLGFDKSGEKIFLLDARGRDTQALKTVDLATGAEEVLAHDERSDIAGAMYHPVERRVEAVLYEYDRPRWEVLDESIEGDLDYLQGLADGTLRVASRSRDDRRWVVAFNDDDGPVRYYLYDRDAGKARFLFSNRPELEDLPLAPMHPVVIGARDGLELVSYLTLPPWTDADGDGRPKEPLPMVLFVHGGPWSRDSWGLNPRHQWLANRGYAVLSVNFRGSTGFGKTFLNASNGEWSGKMHDDLVDAVMWAIEEKIAHPDQVGIMGGSYGGYATLVGLTFTPDLFAAGVDVVGPSNLLTLMRNVPPYWRPFLPAIQNRVGDLSTPEGRRQLRMASPLTHVEEISKPLLIAQGANDPRVKRSESDQIVEAMVEKEIPVTYVLYPDEGHGFRRPENSLSFAAVTEAFLAEHLGGRFEPVGDDFEGSSIQVLVGAGEVPGLENALMERPVPVTTDPG